MKCPKCSAETESGFIQAGHMMIWTPQKHKLSLTPRNDGKDIVLGRDYIGMPSIEAYCCRKCGFIMIPIPAGEDICDD